MRLPGGIVAGIAGLSVVAGLLVACAPEVGPEPTLDLPSGAVEQACADAVEQIVDAVADLAASYEGDAPAAGADDGAADATATEDPLAAAVADARRARDRLDCNPEAFTEQLRDGLTAIAPEGAIADAVARRASASILGTLRQDAGEWVLAEGERLQDVFAVAADGTTVVLPAGTIELDTTAVLLEGLTLKGAGRDATVIRSTAPDAAVIVATASLVALEDLTLEHAGTASASGIVAGPSASMSLTGVRATGAVADESGAGGAGLYLAAQGDEASGRGTTVEVTDSVFDDNDWAGVAVSGGHRVSIESTRFAGNGEIGILFLDASDGSVANSEFRGNGVGVAASGTSSPTLVNSSLTGGSVGVQLDGSATPTIEGLRISGSETGAVIFGGRSAGSISDTVCTDVPYGIVIGDDAAPTLGDNDCSIARGAG